MPKRKTTSHTTTFPLLRFILRQQSSPAPCPSGRQLHTPQLFHFFASSFVNKAHLRHAQAESNFTHHNFSTSSLHPSSTKLTCAMPKRKATSHTTTFPLLRFILRQQSSPAPCPSG